ncbi:hypothetical protein RMATCC62417_01602 [Rhizopus microsporus]|nr:hypothetical protein RMATCC62417_01602 [Rhizopus microsporus]
MAIKALKFPPTLKHLEANQEETNEWHSLPSLSRRLPKPDSRQPFCSDQPTIDSRIIDRGTTTPAVQLTELKDKDEDDIFFGRINYKQQQPTEKLQHTTTSNPANQQQ